ncbi:MAG: penicillin-binding protein 2 [Elusimicrobia bacterium]|nr:penicillin-binding protein 2 [Elusimicrobiota bacterium]MBU2615007.1 penicillin-binding protein 2 [Elusimicrobiota bacterium]
MVWEGESNIVQEKFLARLNRIFFTILVIFSFIGLRFFYFQIIRGNYYLKVSEQNSSHLFLERAPRGIIYDRYGKRLCENKPVTLVLFYPFSKKNNRSFQNTTEKTIERILPGTKDKIIEGYNNSRVVSLAEDIDRNTMFRLLEQKINLKDISVVTEMRRFYPYNEMFSNMIGYIGEVSQPELESMTSYGYKQGDIIGKNGLEKQYDEYLRGEDGGWVIESNASGRQLGISSRIEPVPGKDIHLTIDLELQKVAEDELLKTGCAGAVVGIDPSNGAVRILVSQPGFDPNLFVGNSKERLKYFTDKKLPTFNRAVQGEYAPGSVFKIITSAAALNENIITLDETYFCPGYFTIGKKTFKCWEKKGHKNMSFFSGVQNSCGVYFYNIGLKEGIGPIIDYAEKFNLGSKLGIDMPSEKSGFIPKEEWRTKKFKYGWLPGDTVNIAIGQGYITVTPLQLASMISTVANRGRIWKPYLVEKVMSNDGSVAFEHTTEKLSEVELKDAVWDDLIKALTNVVAQGTGYGAQVEGMNIAGKTGTAENPRGATHAWFGAFAPVEKPELAVAVLVEHGGKGGSIAAPIAGRIFAKLKQRYIEKDLRSAN